MSVAGPSGTGSGSGGRAAGTEPVELSVDGELRQTESVELAPGENRTITFNVASDDLAPGRHVFRIDTPTDSLEYVITVGDFRIDDVGTTVENGTLEVAATVANDGATQRSESVQLSVFGNGIDTKTVALAAGEERTVEFSVPTDTLAPGRQPVRVETPTDSETRTVVIDAHTLRIERTGPSTEYRFHLETTGEPEPNADGDRIVRQLVDGEVATIPTCKSTATDGATVGTVTGDSDIYIITGELEFFFKGDTSGRVYLDGEEIDPDTTC